MGLFWLFTKVFAISEGLLREDPRLERLFRVLTLETGLVASGITFVAGVGLALAGVGVWSKRDFGSLNPQESMRWVIPACTLLVLGVQGLFSSFFLSILVLKRRKPGPTLLN